MIGLAPSFSMTNQSRTGGGDAQRERDHDRREKRAREHDPEDRRAGADDHDALEAEMPDARALRDDAGRRDVNQRCARTQYRDHELVKLAHVGSFPRRRRRFSNPDFAVMKSAMEALKMSMAAAGKPATMGR